VRVLSKFLSSLLMLQALAPGCSKPPPGVLTLAPAMMSTSGATQGRPDGSLQLQSGAAAATEIYLPQGSTNLAITLAATADVAAGLQVWFSGSPIVDLPPLAEGRVIKEILSADRAGAYALRLMATGPAEGSVTVTKVVLSR
jgi:hypothetical protein